jgi:hypothetical protein
MRLSGTKGKFVKEIELYIHSFGNADPSLVRIDEEATVEELTKKIESVAGLPSGVEHFVFIESTEEVVEGKRRLCDCGIKHRHHLHCHSCKRVHVIVSYNGAQKEHQFVPSTKIRAVLKWALYAFELRGADAEGKVLRLGDSELLGDAHIGSFAKPQACQVHLALTPIVRVEG